MIHLLNHIMRVPLLSITASLLCPIIAKSEDTIAPNPPEAPATEFIRVVRNETSTRLQTAVTRYSRDLIDVDLIGAVHIADKTYYDTLNSSFKAYPTLLFEMIGGENLGKGNALNEVKKKPAGALSLLGTFFEKTQEALDLKGQKDEIDYSAENFVHADFSIEEFHHLNEKRKQSLAGFMLQQSLKKTTGKQPSSAGLLLALLSRNPNKLKLQLVDTLGEGDSQMADISGDNVIINDRNLKCLSVMQKEIENGTTKIGIFYGAAHYPDMEKRLIAMGFKLTKQTWLDAWRIPKKQMR